MKLEFLIPLLGFSLSIRAANLPEAAQKFVTAHCAECHDADTKEGGLDLTALPFDLKDAKNFDTWVKIHDRVRDGEMPPAKKDVVKPQPADVASFLKDVSTPMIAADRAKEASEGRATLRRMNRYEDENAVRDLLGAPWLQIKEMLPEDGESHRFNKSGEALAVSHVHMASYLNAAEYALREALGNEANRPATKTVRYYAREQRTFVSKMKFSQFNKSSERATFPILGTEAQVDVLEQKAPVTVGEKDPETREKEAMGVVASTYEPMEIRFDQFTAPVGGHYKIKLSAYTFWAGGQSEAKWWAADRTKVSKGRTDEPVTVYSQMTPRLLRRLGAMDFSPDPSVKEMDVWLLPGESIQPDAARLFRSRPSNWHNPLATKEGMPGVAFKWLEVTGPIYDQWPTVGQNLMFGDLPLVDGKNGVEAVSKNPQKDAERLLRAFMKRAYREPVPETDVKRILTLIDSAMKAGNSFTDSMIAGYSAVLCSPGFIVIDEKPGTLDDSNLAERLALFLWNSTPDDELRLLAARGELHKPEVLKKQTDRLLADDRSRRFVDAFLDYWLDLRKIVATAPDASLYPDYYLDDLLTESAELETQLFFAELVKNDMATSNIVSSDFSILNERLAAHYGIPGVSGVAMRWVQLPQGSVRGGLMTQASVLKVTANGTTTSPVLRGAWIMERVLGKPPPPPPPSVPAIEPDIRGATTIREQLDQHRKLPTCAACHAKIDPAGFALENFDVMGGWREKYRSMGDVVKPEDLVQGYGHNGQKFGFHLGPQVDASGDVPGGGHFKDVAELKALLLKDQRQVARNLTGQLVTYATGAPIRFGDRPSVEKILDEAQTKDYGVRTLIEQIVESDLFLNK